MKQVLIILSSITTLTLVSNISLNIVNSNTATNDYVYNLFNNGLGMNKNNSTNYIFDSSNNLIEVCYNQWTNNDIQKNDINYEYCHSYVGFVSSTSYCSATYTLINWSWLLWCGDWDTFTKIYPNFAFDSDSHCRISISTGIIKNCILNGNTTKIVGSVKSFSSQIIDTKDVGFGTHIAVSFNLWHDDRNIYFNWNDDVYNWCDRVSKFDVKINQLTFTNSKR